MLSSLRFNLAVLCTISVLRSNVVNAHSRLECPPPRSRETGAKGGPCDAQDDPTLPAYPLHPGLNTVTWLESLSHPGAPARFALSSDGVDDGFESCLLLDHVPHDERSLPSIQDELTYHRSSITLFIPDVKCERCHLQLISFMTDDGHGVPEGTKCAYEGAQIAGTADASLPKCEVVYHSCAPVSINGTVPRDEFTCSMDEFVQELDWPFMEDKPPASTYYFKGDPGMFNETTARLLSGGSPIENCGNLFYCDPNEFYNVEEVVPEGAKYTEPHGTCAAIVEMVVEPFELGKLPSVKKNGTMIREVDACTPCAAFALCYADACILRNAETGLWFGQAELCNDGAENCEECFTDSLCYMGVESDSDEETQNEEPPSSGFDIDNESASGEDAAEQEDVEASADSAGMRVSRSLTEFLLVFSTLFLFV